MELNLHLQAGTGILPGKMRLRITRPLDGSIDGIQLDQFVPGQIYEVGTAIGSYLLSMEAAEPAPDTAAVTPVSFEQQLYRAIYGPPLTHSANDRKSKGNKKRGR